MALCGTVDTNQSTDVSVGGSLVSHYYILLTYHLIQLT